MDSAILPCTGRSVSYKYTTQQISIRKMISTPLRVVGIVSSSSLDAVSFFEAVRMVAFSSSNAQDPYLSADYFISPQLCLFSLGEGTPMPSQPELDINSSLHTLIVLLCDHALRSNTTVMQRLQDVANAIAQSTGRHRLVAFYKKKIANNELGALDFKINPCRVYSMDTLGERTSQSTYVALLVLHEAHKLLLEGLGKNMTRTESSARLLVSHAKTHGELPLEALLRSQLDRLHWFNGFYDAKDIPPGEELREMFEEGDIQSMLVVLRTDAYDLRFWCQQEVI
jgi:hypothetical protein